MAETTTSPFEVTKASNTVVPLILRKREPENLESSFAALDGFITPTDRFYVRSHFPVPSLDTSTWRLQVEGAVKQTIQFSYEELRQLPAYERPATLECAGNSRAFLIPAVKGVQWEAGAVGNAQWRGARLSDVLAQAGLLPSTLEIIFEGADQGEPDEPPKPSGTIHYAYSLPASRALQDDVLLAYEMNGSPLSPAHGYPVRLVVPGWYGMASVKWLTKVIVSETPFAGYYPTVDYARWIERHGHPVRVPLSEMGVKSLIARPARYETIPAGSSYRVYGAAWTGGSEIVQVELSADDGLSWEEAKLIGPSHRHAWRLWEWTWQVPADSGRHTLLSRATDDRGNVQPMKHHPNNETYVIHHSIPVEVEVL